MSDPTKALEAKARGNAHFKKGEWDDAIKEYSQAIELDATQHSFFSNRSACYASRGGAGDFESALADGDKCVTLKPDWAKGYSRKGLAQFKLGKIEEALETYEAGLKQDPNNQSLLEGKQQCSSSMQRGNRMMQVIGQLAQNPATREAMQDPEVMTKLSKFLGDPASALRDPTIMNDPKMKPILEAMMSGAASPAGGSGGGSEPSKPPPSKKAKVEKKEEKAPTPPPKSEAELKNDEAKALYKKKDFNGALAAYQAASELEPENPKFPSNASAVLFMQGKYDECETMCKKVIELAKYDSKWIAKGNARLASVEEKRGNLEGAMKFLEAALLEVSDGKVRERLRKMKAAKKKADDLSYVDPEKALAHKAKGNEFFKAGKWPEAVKEYTEALKRDPSNHTVYSNRATCYSKLMAFDSAMKDCEKCLAIEPKWTKALIRKGRIHHLKKEYHKAKGAYQKALAIDPQNAELHKFLGDTQRAIQSKQGKEVDEKEQRRILSDPEIQKIIKDPEIDFILKRAQADPSILNKAMRDDPEKARKIQVLFDAGVIRTG